MAEIGDRPRWLLPGLLPGMGDGLLLVLPGHVPAPEGATPIAAAVIHAALRRWLADLSGRSVAMQLYRAVTAPFASEPQSWSEGEIESQLEPVLRAAFDERRLVAYSSWGREQSPGGGGSEPPPSKPPRSRPPPSRPPPSKPPPSKPPPSKPPVVEPRRILTVALVSLTVKTDHQLLKNNPPKSWLNVGELVAEPEWTPSDQHPLSHTMDSEVSVEVALDVGPADGTPEMGVLTGTGPGALKFVSEPTQFKPGPMTVALTSTGKLPKKIHELDLAIAWKVTWDRAGMHVSVTPSQTKNELFVTMARPREEDFDPQGDNDNAEDGVTLRRMRRAMERVEPLASLDPHFIVEKLFARVPSYTLITNDEVPPELRHPDYFNMVGGPWPLTDYERYFAECQAIVRMVSAIVHQLGIPGDTETMLVWADPLIDDGNTVLEAPMGVGGLTSQRVRNGVVERAKLSDAPVTLGKTYQKVPGQPGMNNFEACLRFDQGGKVVYYGGGAGQYANKEEVIQAFWGLVWLLMHPSLSPDQPESYTVTEIVRVF